MLKDSRLCIFKDISESSFLIGTSETIFARVNKIGCKWYVWYYINHLQSSFYHIKDVLREINQQFKRYYKAYAVY